ncbi:MAG TPA: hypothetical protein VGN42_15155 [Pirellulales bacterium]|nr:hypothetical protein [Pirellulales bacterium]
MSLHTRRQFVRTVGAGLLAAPLLANEPMRAADKADPTRKRLAVVTTLWNYRSHAWHMAERFLAGYPLRGKWHRPPLEVVSAYVDQTPEGDLSRGRAAEFGFTIYPTVAETLCCGGEKLAVDAVLVIGEHGDYPLNEIGQKQYPRYQFFQQIVEVFRRSGRTAPVFNDKHLSWNFAWAKEMVDTSHSMGFGLLAGSSLPVTWRMPAIDLPYGAEVEEALVVAHGKTDIYDFHALEALQSFVERRRGGETGVTAMHALRGDKVWKALAAGSWSAGGCDSRLFEACLSRSHTLRQGESFSHRYPKFDQMREWVEEPIAYRFEYADGLKATMLLMNGLVEDFTVAARLKGQAEPLSTLYHLPPNPNVVYSAALMSKAEEMFVGGKAPYPVERTLLASGLVQAALQSLADGQQRLETPQLAVRYQAPRESLFWQS